MWKPKTCCEKYLLQTLLFLLCIIQLAGGAWLRCYKGSLQNYLVTPLDRQLPTFFTSCLDQSLPTIIYTFGYRGRAAGPATTAVLTAYLATKKRNVLLLDWEEEAKSGLLGIPLGYTFFAVPNAKKVGKQMGNMLMQLFEADYLNMTHIHLIGHSLGAHIMAYAGKQARARGHIVPRITGLDPARALFDGPFAVQSGLDHTCARFVDVVHSDPGGYGTSTSTGTVDIWPNYEGSKSTQPGCSVGDFEKFSAEDLCSHDRSWRYYVEAIASPTAFPAIAAPDYNSWLASAGQTKDTIYLGDLTSTRARGNFYLTTNSQPLYGKGQEGMKPNPYQWRQRHNSTLTRLFDFLR